MISRERVFALLEGNTVDRLPFDLPATPPIEAECERRLGTKSLNDAFGADFKWLSAPFPGDPARWREVYAQRGLNYPESASIDGLGLVHLRPDRASLGDAWHLMEMAHPLAGDWTTAEVDALPWPSYCEADLAAGMMASIAQAKAEGKVAAVGLECTVFELAWYLRGMEDLFMDLAMGEGPAEGLLDRMMHRSIAAARASGMAGADLVCLGDDVGTQRGMMMSPEQWRSVLKPRLAQVVEAARSTGVRWIRYHSDGDIRPIIPDLIEIGVNILNPVQPECMNYADLARQYGQDLAFFGMIGTQTTMPFGTEAQVRQVTKQLIADHRRYGYRLIVAPTHVLEPDVPWENIVALVDTLREGAR